MDIETLAANLNKICRACLKECMEDVTSRSVFGELNDSEIMNDNVFFVYEILCSVTSVEIAKGDGYPSLICSDCMHQASNAYKFKQQYEKAQDILKECIKYQHSDDITVYKLEILEDDSDEHENDYEYEQLESCYDINDDKSENLDTSLECESTIKLEPCLSSNIFNLDEIDTENVNIETIFDNIDTETDPEKPKIKNVSLHNSNKTARKCTECGFIFQTLYAFNNHSCNRNSERKLCPICGKSISRSHYNKHLYMHSGRRDYVCRICHKAYNASGSLKFHMATHTGEKPYLCSLCGKRFIQPTALKYHMRFHNNERRYKCNICSKCFVMQCHLVAHQRSHTGVKPFMCETCGKGFTRKVELTAHSFLHSGQKPFGCGFCNKTFVRKTHLTLHEMTHSGKRPHQCKVCGKGFIQRQPLMCHLKMHSKKEREQEPKEHETG